MKVEDYLPRFTMKREDPLGMRKTSYEEKGPTVKQEHFLGSGKANFKIAWLTMKREDPLCRKRTHCEGEDPLGRGGPTGRTYLEGEGPPGKKEGPHLSLVYSSPLMNFSPNLFFAAANVQLVLE